MRYLFSFVLFSMLLGGCTAVNTYYDPSRPHHTQTGFTNNYAPTVNKSRADLVRWLWESHRKGLPKPPAAPIATQAPDLAAVHARSNRSAPLQPAITWIGHGTMLVQSGRMNVLTDPILSEPASAMSFIGPRRAQPPGVALKDLPAIDLVLISHNHYAHLDRQTNPAEAVRIHKDLGARRSVGLHWGTFNLTDESLDQPPRDLAQARLAQGLREEEFSVLKIGETRPFPARTGSP